RQAAEGDVRTEPVPGGETQRENPEQRDHAEGGEDEQGWDGQPREGAGAAHALRRRGRPPSRRHSDDRAHLPMTAFMLVANSSGPIDSWNSLAMLSSSTSAAVG